MSRRFLRGLLVVVLYPASCMGAAIYSANRAFDSAQEQAIEPVQDTIPRWFPVLALESPAATEVRRLFFSDLDGFKARHPDHTFLIPPELVAEDDLIEIVDLEPGRQEIVVELYSEGEGSYSYKGWYEATEREIEPSQFAWVYAEGTMAFAGLFGAAIATAIWGMLLAFGVPRRLIPDSEPSPNSHSMA